MDQQVGRYRIANLLGRGAMGVVYLAEDPVLRRQVAIKMVDVAVDDPSRRDFLRSRLLRDARAAAALSHPNIVTVHDVLEEGGKAYVVMEYIAGESLAAILQKSPMPDSAFTLRVLREMAAALDYTHSRGIIHRDIKPGNVMIDANRTTKIMDFGIARVHDTAGSTATGMVMGTIEYMAPEQVKGETLDGRADQFSLAATAYQMMSGSTLFGQHSFTTLTYKIVHEVPPPVSARNAALPAAVDGVLAKALSKAPAGRFATCGEFVEALEEAFAGEAPASHQITRIAPAAAVTTRRSYRGMAAILTTVVLAAGALMLWRPWAAPAQPQTRKTAGTPTQQALPPPVAETLATPTPPKPGARRATAANAQPVDPSEADAEDTPVAGPAQQLYDRAQESMKTGQYEEAIRSLNQAIRIRPDFSRAFLSRGIAHQHLDHNEAAIQDYSEVIRLKPRNPRAYYERGICYARLLKNDLALADYNQALRLKPQMHLALNARGMVLLKQKDYPKALADFNEAIRVAPDFGPAYQNRARARQAMGDASGAKADREKALELTSRHPS